MPLKASTITVRTQLRQARATDYPAIVALITSPDELFRVFPAGSWPLTIRQIHRLAEQCLDLTVTRLPC